MNGETQVKCYFKLIIILTLSIIILGCKDKIVDPPNDKKIAFYGKVVDQNDNLLSNVSVHYIYYLGENVELRNATISYSLPSSQNVILQVYDIQKNPISKLVDQYQNAGQYMIYFNGDSFTNGIYRYKISGQTMSYEGSFPLITYDINKLISTPPITLSDNNGEFLISYSVFGIGMKYHMQTIQKELIVADSIKFVLHKEGFQDIIKSVKLDTTKVLEKTFMMIKK